MIIISFFWFEKALSLSVKIGQMLSTCREDACVMQKLIRFLYLKSIHAFKKQIHLQFALLILEKLSSETLKEYWKIRIPPV